MCCYHKLLKMSSATIDTFDSVNEFYEELNFNQKSNVENAFKSGRRNERSAKWSVKTSKSWLLKTIVETMLNPENIVGKSTQLMYVCGGTLYATELPEVDVTTKTIVPCVTNEEMVTMGFTEPDSNATKSNAVPKNQLRLFATFNREISVHQFCRWLGFDEAWSAVRLSSIGLHLYKNVSYDWLNYFVGFCTLYKPLFVERGTFAVKEQSAVLKKQSYHARKLKARLVKLQQPLLFEYAWSKNSVQSMRNTRIKLIKETQQELYEEQNKYLEHCSS